jgi:GAF domain
MGSVASTWTLDRTRGALENVSRARLDWPAFGEEVARHLRRSIGFDGWCVMQTDPDTLLPARALAADSPATTAPRRIWQIEFHVPDVCKLAYLARGGQRVSTVNAATGGDLARSPRWDEIMRPAGITDELRAALVSDGRCWGSLSLFRAAARPFTGEDIRRVTEVLAAVAAGTRAAWTTMDLPSAAAPAASGPGTIIVTADGTLVTATPAAVSWLARLGLAGKPASGLASSARSSCERPRAAPGRRRASARGPSTGTGWTFTHPRLPRPYPAAISPSPSCPRRRAGSSRC